MLASNAQGNFAERLDRTSRWTSKDTGGTSPSTSATYPRRNELRRLTDLALSCVAQAADGR